MREGVMGKVTKSVKMITHARHEAELTSKSTSKTKIYVRKETTIASRATTAFA